MMDNHDIVGDDTYVTRLPYFVVLIAWITWIMCVFVVDVVVVDADDRVHYA